MRFVDCVTIFTSAGHGGAGSVSYRREKYVARGGPWGGNGGRGGSVILRADNNIGTLLDLRYRREIVAEDGHRGDIKLRDGRDGRDEIIRVPVGTMIRDADTGELLADLDHDGAELIAAAGGRGGLGNAAFKTSTRQTPHFAQPGEPGDERTIVLELKLLADVGIIGFPSVGKSTLISVISNARPKIAAYPFTTLTPNLGIVGHRDYRTFVVADIPGLIEGASEGRGLGYQFLRHVERCRALLHVIEVTPGEGDLDDGRDPVADFDAIQAELAAFSEALAARPQIVALAKADLPFVAERADELRAIFEERGLPFFVFSAVTREGLVPLLDAMAMLIDQTPAPDVAHFTVPEAEPVPGRGATPDADDDGDDDSDLGEEGPEAVWVFEDDDE